MKKEIELRPTLPASTTSLVMWIETCEGLRCMPVDDVFDASTKYAALRDENCYGSRDMGFGKVKEKDSPYKPVALISYNGKIHLG